MHQETVVHLFLEGSIVEQVWQHYFRAFGFHSRPAMDIAPAIMSWLLSTSVVNHIRWLVPVVILWFLWNARNAACFQGKPMHPHVIIMEIDNYLRMIGAANRIELSQVEGDTDSYISKFFHLKPPKQLKLTVVRWNKPECGYFKLNTDASICDKRASGGGLLRDSNGKLIFAYYKEFGDMDVIQAECSALLYGLQLCAQNNIQNVLVKVDSLNLVRLLQDEFQGRWSMCYELRETRCYKESLLASINHVFKEANSAADFLASMHQQHDFITSSLNSLPQKLKAILYSDRIGIPYIRKRCTKH